MLSNAHVVSETSILDILTELEEYRRTEYEDVEYEHVVSGLVCFEDLHVHDGSDYEEEEEDGLDWDVHFLRWNAAQGPYGGWVRRARDCLAIISIEDQEEVT